MDTETEAMMPETDDTREWIQAEMQDLCKYWDDISQLEKCVALEAVGERISQISDKELLEKYESLVDRNLSRHPNVPTCIQVIETLSTEQKRHLLSEFSLSDTSGTDDDELTEKLILNLKNCTSYARSFALRYHIGRNFMAPGE